MGLLEAGSHLFWPSRWALPLPHGPRRWGPRRRMPSRPSQLGLQPTDPQQVVGGPYQMRVLFRPGAPPEPALAQAANGLDPSKDLLHPFADPLTEGIAWVPGRPAVQARGAPTCDAGSGLKRWSWRL